MRRAHANLWCLEFLCHRYKCVGEVAAKPREHSREVLSAWMYQKEAHLMSVS